jgi:hypothetical protein
LEYRPLLAWTGRAGDNGQMHVRTVRRYLDKLQADGLISIEERRDENGHRQSDLITLIGYQEWVTALRNGGKVDKPKEIKGYSLPDKLSGDLPDKTEGLPTKTGCLPDNRCPLIRNYHLTIK